MRKATQCAISPECTRGFKHIGVCKLPPTAKRARTATADAEGDGGEAMEVEEAAQSPAGSAAAALRAAAAEGLTLKRSSNAAGFKGVRREGRLRREGEDRGRRPHSEELSWEKNRFSAAIGAGGRGERTCLQRESNSQSPAPAPAACRPGDDEFASRCRYLGTFNTPEEAALAYARARTTARPFLSPSGPLRCRGCQKEFATKAWL